jgi:hypothetical protein
VEGFEYKSRGRWGRAGVHRFDPQRCHFFHRAWMSASCPHIYWVMEDNHWTYGGEILEGALGRERAMCTVFRVPPHCIGLVIAELEYEMTCLEQISVNGRYLAHQLHLRIGDRVDIAARPGDVVGIRGWYVTHVNPLPEPIRKRQQLSPRTAFERELPNPVSSL